ncbi:MAG: hypothetical protein HGB19_05470 [Chlorobiales bacterium]|jgi:C4-dicarboxylate-specific signal transduction histidine kinase|nr:hypothetical protein [Chlorobiales bacterium]
MSQTSFQTDSEALQILELHRLSLLGAVITSVIHELNQPLTSMNMDASFLDMIAGNPDRMNPAAIGAVGKGILNDVLRCQKILDHLRLLAHRQTCAEPTDLNKVIENCFLLTNERIRSHGIALSVDLPATPVSISINPFDLEYALLSLILNACNLIEAKQEEDKSVSEQKNGQNPAVISIQLSQKNSTVKLAITDNGHAIFKKLYGQETDPILMQLPSGKTRPNGLFLARQLIKELGGELIPKRYDDKALGEVNLVEITLPMNRA